MASVNRKVVMMGISTILIPLGKWILKKMASKGIDKLADASSADERDSLGSRSHPVREGA